MKKIIELLILLMPISLSADVQTSSGNVHLCLGESDTVYYSGEMPQSPGGSCCDEEGSWVKDGSVVYEWSGAASGTSESPSLDTSSSGSISVSVIVTQKWKCSIGDETTDSTSNGSGGFEVDDGPAYEGYNPCTPPGIQDSGMNAHPDISTGLVTRWETIHTHPVLVRDRYNLDPGVVTNVVRDHLFEADGHPAHSSDCGGQIPTVNKTTSSWSAGISFGFKGLGVSVSWSGAGANYALFDKADAQGQQNKYKIGQAQKVFWKVIGGRYQASGTKTRFHNNNPVTEGEPVSIDDVILLTGSDRQLQAYDYRICVMCCNS